VVPRADQVELIQGYNNCKDFASLCKKRVDMLEEYRKEADKIIEDQEKRVVAYKDEVNAQKRDKNFLGPFLGLVAGFAAGYFYHQSQK
jgi:hypothetical protein